MSANPLAALFGSTRRKVLGVLFGSPDQEFYLRELARTSGVAVGAVQRDLVRLTESGIVVRTVRGNQVYYRANPECPIYTELFNLISKTVGVTGVLRAALLPLADQIRVAFIFGSAARGRLQPASDVDIFIVGDISLKQIIAVLRPAQQRLARELNPTVYPTEEFRRKMVDGHHFVTSVMGEPKVFLVGGERELAGLVAERLAERTSHESAGDC